MNNKNKLLLLVFSALILAPNAFAWSHQTIDSIATNLAIILFALSLHVRIGLGMLVLAPFALLAPFEIIYILTYGQPSNAHLLGVLIDTNLKEVDSYLNGIGLKLLVLVFLTSVFVGICLFLSMKHQWRWSGRIRIWFLISGSLVTSILVAQDYFLDDIDVFAGANVHNNKIIQGDGSLTTSATLMESYPAGVVFRVNSFLNQKRGLREAAEVIGDFHFGAKQREKNNSKEVHVLVIGETGRADRWQLNGYARETNPLLSKIDDVVSFSNTITGWAWTRMSVPVILTRKKSQNKNAFFAEKSVVSAFKEAGFSTYWLSTQGSLGLHESSIALHAQEAGETRFLNLTDYRGKNVYDEVLLSPLKDVLDKNEKKQFIVLHTLGSHYDYSNRYPIHFDKFLPSMKENENASLHDIANREVLNNSYDNSILYTDYILSKIINNLKKSKVRATLFYTSDHGENIFDNGCDVSGHGHTTESDFRVASMWWNSKSYEQSYPEHVEYIKSRKNSPLTTEHVFHSLLDIADITYPSEDRTMSIADSSWKPIARWTQAGLDFDLSGRDALCKRLISMRK